MNERRFSISVDELMYYQQQQHKAQEPGRKGTECIEAGIRAVYTSLGIDVTKDNIPEQMADLGVFTRSLADDRMPRANGIYVFQWQGNNPVPIAWVGDARLDGQGKAWIDIEWFTMNKHEEIGGIKVAG